MKELIEGEGLNFDSVDEKKIQYYCFGSEFLQKDGSIDYKALKDELEEHKYFLAAMMFDTEEVSKLFVRLLPFTPARWIFECEDYDVTEEDFKKLCETEFFKKFAAVLPKKIQMGLAALGNLDKAELSKFSIKPSETEKIFKDAKRAVAFVEAAVKNPKMKTFNLK